MGLTNESVRAMTGEECPRKRGIKHLFSEGNTCTGQRGSGHLVVSSNSAAASLIKLAQSGRMWCDEAIGKPRQSGCMRTSA